MQSYKIRISIDAISDIQEATDWYNNQVPKLGTRFRETTKKQINLLKKGALNHGVRYGNVRCALIEKFPFLIHFTVDEKSQIVEVFAVFHTSRNPKIWNKRVNH
jgi:plasmid stabilization system protein ParE